MRMHTRDHQMMVKDTSKTINLRAILFITWFILYNNPMHQYNVFLLTYF